VVATRSTQQPKRPGFTQWLEKLSLTDSTKDKLRAMITSPDILLIGQEMVEILHELNMDDVSLQAALVYPYCQRHELDDQQIEIKFGKAVQQLVSGVRRMDAIRSLHYYKGEGASEEQIDSVRRMLLAMVEDVRAILIKLAERICDL
jgi:GTP pyrophosphokinase